MYVDPGENLGFGRACNLGATHAAGCTHLLFLNPDVVLTGDFAPLIEVSNTTEATLISALLRRPNGLPDDNLRRTITPLSELLSCLLPTRLDPGFVRHRRRDAPFIVDQASGALLLCRVETWQELGGFDPLFELYYDDVDLCRRAKSNGGTWVVPLAVGIHIGGVSYNQNRTAAYEARGVSRMRYLRKWYGSGGACFAAFIGVVELIVRGASRQAEGPHSRRHSLAAQFRELRRAGSQHCLTARRDSDRPIKRVADGPSPASD
jgi:hypothetical protein